MFLPSSRNRCSFNVPARNFPKLLVPSGYTSLQLQPLPLPSPALLFLLLLFFLLLAYPAARNTAAVEAPCSWVSRAVLTTMIPWESCKLLDENRSNKQEQCDLVSCAKTHQVCVRSFRFTLGNLKCRHLLLKKQRPLGRG